MSRVRIAYGTYIDGIAIEYQPWNAGARKFEGAIFPVSSVAGPLNPVGAKTTQVCELATQPVNGIRGRASSLVDALGVSCDEP